LQIQDAVLSYHNPFRNALMWTKVWNWCIKLQWLFINFS
jgi:hypothetical protein